MFINYSQLQEPFPIMKHLLIAASVLVHQASFHNAEAFSVPPSYLTRPSSSSSSIIGTKLFAEEEGLATDAIAPDDYDRLPPEDNDTEEKQVLEEQQKKENERTHLKSQLYQLAASYDRGFGATPKARDEADDIIQQLSSINPTSNAANGIDGDAYGNEEVPLKAIWRMVWTSAFDVVSLGASPFAAPSAIYQDIRNPPVAINIIDFIPRAQTFFPSSISPPSLLRAEVATKASSRNGMEDRVGLLFEGLKLQPIEFLGRKVDNLPPLSIDFGWPRNLIEPLAEYVPGLEKLGLGEGANDADAPGYFDVEYVDDELLIIRQQVPGGVFALVKVDNCDP